MELDRAFRSSVRFGPSGLVRRVWSIGFGLLGKEYLKILYVKHTPVCRVYGNLWKEAEIFGMCLFGDGATVKRMPLTNVLGSGHHSPTHMRCNVPHLIHAPEGPSRTQESPSGHIRQVSHERCSVPPQHIIRAPEVPWRTQESPSGHMGQVSHDEKCSVPHLIHAPEGPSCTQESPSGHMGQVSHERCSVPTSFMHMKVHHGHRRVIWDKFLMKGAVYHPTSFMHLKVLRAHRSHHQVRKHD